MKTEINRADVEFREQVRTWLEENRPREPRPHNDFAAERAYDCAWQRRQYDGGWAGIGWPLEYGGRGLSLLRQLIWFEEYARAKCPPPIDACWLGLNHAGPTLIALGTEQQKKKHLPAVLRGDEVWCQGFSEPNAGSDLASIRTRGVIDGDYLVVTGQKTWTSFAHLSDYQELLVRTDPSTSRHTGLTWIIGDMHAPGVTVRPIRSLTGAYHNCEVFYDEVRIPLVNVVGEINRGWSVAMATLGFERGTAGFGESNELAVLLDELIDHARTTADDNGRPLIANEAIARDLGQAKAEVQALQALNRLTISRAEGGGPPGAEGSIVRLFMSELEKSVGRLAMEILGVRGLNRLDHDKWTHYYLFSFCQTIAGGTSEIQRNIIGERLLGLPR